MNDELRTRRIEYETAGLDVADVAADPLEQWRRWYDDASAAGVTEPNAMTIATVGLDGHPDARTVLARGADDRSLVFFTNYDSVKSRQLDSASARRRRVRLARSPSPGPAARRRRARRRWRERRLLRQPAT